MRKPEFKVRPCKVRDYKFKVIATVNGERHRHFFKTKGEAQAFADLRNNELKEQGLEGVAFPIELRAMAIRATQLLEPFKVTIEDAAKYYADVLASRKKSAKLPDAVEACWKTRQEQGRSRNYIYQLRSDLRKLAAHLGDVYVSDIETRHLVEFMSTRSHLGPAAKNGVRTRLYSFFAWARTMGYCERNEAYFIEKVPEIDAEPGVLTPEHLSELLHKSPPELVPYFAIGAFAGIRAAEIARLDWAEIDLEAGLIEIQARKAKTAKRRLVKIEPVLMAWLKPLARQKGKIVPPTLKKRVTYVYRVLMPGVEFPDNWARHSFASYHLAHFSDAAKLALELGHTRQEMLFQHYRKRVRPDVAARWWQVFPQENAPSLQIKHEASASGLNPWERPPYRMINYTKRPPYVCRVQWRVKPRKWAGKCFRTIEEGQAWADARNAEFFAGAPLLKSAETRIERMPRHFACKMWRSDRQPKPEANAA